jgi:hypothetical protein
MRTNQETIVDSVLQYAADQGARLTPAARDLANRRSFRVLHPHWKLLLGEGSHAAAAKRVSFSVSRQYHIEVG